MGLPFANRRFITAAIVASTILVIWHIYNSPFYDRIYSSTVNSQHPEDPCRLARGLEDVLVVLKTGATEAWSKLPVHLGTTLRCVPHWAVYSDYDEQIAGFEVRDVLDHIDEQIKMTNPDFDLYNRLQRDGKAALNQTEVDSWGKAANTASGTMGNPAWRLDKWKFLPLVDKALEYKPDAKWVVFVEADTYISWPALVQWLVHFDHSKPVYLGNQMQIGDVIFGHGGSGYVLSNSAMHMVSQQRASRLDEYDKLTAEHWAGDCILGKVASDAGIPLTWSWPNLVGDFGNIDYGSVAWDKRLWCHRSVSHHHLAPEEVRDFWEFEKTWYSQNRSPPRHKDLFEHFVMPRIRDSRDGWDNFSPMPIDNASIKSFEECGQACEAQLDCLQFSYVEDECRISNTTMLGQSTLDEPRRIRSGWLADRINKHTDGFEKCDGDEWVLP